MARIMSTANYLSAAFGVHVIFFLKKIFLENGGGRVVIKQTTSTAFSPFS